MLIQKDAGTPMVRAALLITAKTWKQPCVHQQMNEWIKKMWYIRTMEHFVV